jgi:ribonuclease P protein component
VLRRSKRIHGNDAVEVVIKKGESKKTRSFVLTKRANKLDRNRYGIVISGKLEKSAVKRNKKRRQIYESIRILEKQGLIAISPPSDIVLLARKPIMNFTFDEIFAAIKLTLTNGQT